MKSWSHARHFHTDTLLVHFVRISLTASCSEYYNDMAHHSNIEYHTIRHHITRVTLPGSASHLFGHRSPLHNDTPNDTTTPCHDTPHIPHQFRSLAQEFRFSFYTSKVRSGLLLTCSIYSPTFRHPFTSTYTNARTQRARTRRAQARRLKAGLDALTRHPVPSSRPSCQRLVSSSHRHAVSPPPPIQDIMS